MERLEAPCRGSSKSTPRVLQITTKWERGGNGQGGHWRVLQGKGGQRPRVWQAGLGHSRKQGQLLQTPSSREMSTGTQIKRAVIGTPGPTQFQYSKLTGGSCFLGPHPPFCLLPLLLGSRSWPAWPANWRYLGSILKSRSFWTYKNHYLKRHGFDPWVRKIPGRRKWQPTPVSWLENPMDRGAWQATVRGVTELYMTEHPSTSKELTRHN